MNWQDLSIEDLRIDVKHGTLAARRWRPPVAGRQGEPILLFHDSLGSIELWRSFPAELARQTGREVIAYDRPGFGQSDARHGSLSTGFIRDEAESVVPLVCDALGVERFVAFGHSVGGGMAVHCAALLGARVAALVTESAQAFVEERTREGIREAQALFRDPAQFGKLARYHGDKTAWVLSAWIDTWLSPAFADWSLDPVLPGVTCPALVLHGSDDEYGSTAHPKRIARLVSGPASLEIMPGTRHVPHREHESAVVRRVAEFLSGL
jgi:pimeloyl-ACP methyl ester carboxylesterase